MTKFKSLAPKTYLVGGAVRNILMGKEPKDLDYVIAETSEEEFRKVFPTVPKVGESFPVFLVEGDETALARIEISTGYLYTEFDATIGVTIEDDLGRRDFSMNSIAQNVVTGEIVDPFNGAADIKNKLIRTVNKVAFIEDSLRIYRGLRFAAEFDFQIESETKELMKEAVEYLGFVPAERVYLELEKLYSRAAKPAIFFQILREIDGLKIHFKPLYLMSKIGAGGVKYGRSNTLTAFDHAMDAFNYAKAHGYSFEVALAALFHDTGKGISKKAATFEEQKHHDHEFKSYIINKQFVKQHRFTAKANNLIVSFAKLHMRFHDLTKIKHAIKLVRFYKLIKDNPEPFIQAANTDHELSAEQLKILNDLRRTFKETKIEIPVEITKKGREATIAFVEQRYVETYNAIKREV